MFKSWQNKLRKQSERESRGTSIKSLLLVCGKYSGSRNVPIQDKQGHIPTSVKDQEARWVEHFKKVLNRSVPEEEPEIPEDLNIQTGPPKFAEIIAAIKSLKNHKSPGIDYLDAGLFKADAVTTASILQPHFNTIRNRK